MNLVNCTPPNETVLPHGAKGIDLGFIAIDFLCDKVLIFRKQSRDHITLHFGCSSGIMDIHRTWETPGRPARHETLFAMKWSDWPRLLADVTPAIFADLRGVVRPLRLGWLARNQIGVLWGALPVEPGHIAAVTAKVKKNKRHRVAVDPARFEENLFFPEYLEDVWDQPDGPFLLVKESRVVGLAAKVAGATGTPRLYWMKPKDIGRLVSFAGPHIRSAATRYAIHPATHQASFS